MDRGVNIGSSLEKHPVHRGMIYPPEAVAEAILYAAEHPKRDMYIGSQAKATQFLGANFPRLTDKFMERMIPPTQYDPDRPSKPREESNLYHAGYGMHERVTNIGWKRSSSLFVKASKQPVLFNTIAAGLGILLVQINAPKIAGARGVIYCCNC
jgi:hypothetical protein